MRHYLPDIRHQKTRRPGGRIFGCPSLLLHLAARWSNATILNPLQPFGTLKSNYHRPLAEVQFEIAPSWTAIARRNYYEYLEKNAFFGPTIRADSTPTPRQFPFVMRFELEIGVGIYESSFSTRNKPACAGWIFESGAIVRSGSNQTPPRHRCRLPCTRIRDNGDTRPSIKRVRRDIQLRQLKLRPAPAQSVGTHGPRGWTAAPAIANSADADVLFKISEPATTTRVRQGH